MGASHPTKLVLAMRSGNRCAFPGCPRELTVDSPGGNEPVSTGQAAHICGERPGAARYNASMTNDERDSYHNLIYLCGDHHTQIDKQSADFSVECLREMKAEHETRVREGDLQGLSQVAFPELARATEWVKRAQAESFPREFTIVAPEEKIRRNELSESRITLTMGLSIASLVHQFVEHEAMLAPGYPDRLKSGFLAEYHRLRSDGLRGESLFAGMCAFAQGGLWTQVEKSAALAVLAYLFERCEVFEK